MNLGITRKSQFDIKGDKKVGDVALTENMDLIVKMIGGNKDITSSTRNKIVIGNIAIQFGRVVKSGSQFTITFPYPFSEAPSFVGVTGASNDGVIINAEIDYRTPPTSTEMTVHVESPSGSEYYYWIAISNV